MNLLLVTQKVDQNDPILGFFCRWIETFAKEAAQKGGTVTVIALSVGTYMFPDNVKVLSLGKEKGGQNAGSRIQYIARFFSALWRERKNYDHVFVHMNPEYVVLAGWLWRLLGKKIFLWYVHRSVTWYLRIAHCFVHGVFSSTPDSFLIKSKKAIFVGHAIPLEVFARPETYRRNSAEDKDIKSHPFRIVSVGRITPIKRLEILIDAAALLRDKGIPLAISIVGEPVYTKDKEYYAALQKKVQEKQLSAIVAFIPAVPNTSIAKWYWQSDLLVNLCPTGGLDKVVLEAMAASTPIVVANRAFAACLGRHADTLLLDTADAVTCADAIMNIRELYIAPQEVMALQNDMQQSVSNFSLPLVIGRMGKIMVSPPNSFILMYHSVGEAKHLFTVTKESFNEQIQELIKCGYYFERLNTIIERIKKGDTVRGAVAITFDDGYRDNYTEAFTILEKNKIPATVFVATDFIAGTSANHLGMPEDMHPLTIQDMQSMVGTLHRGEPLIDIMPHSLSHAKLHHLTYEEAVKEIEESRLWLERQRGLTHPANIFAFPKGRYTQKLIQHLRNSDGRWAGAVTVLPGHLHAETDPFLLPRIAVDSSTTLARFKFKISPVYAWYRRFVSFIGR